MANLLEKFKNRDKSLLFVPFFVSGFPDFDFLEKFLFKNKDKIDILELGVPFSDPVADGPILQEINYRAMVKGVNLNNTLDWLLDSGITKKIDVILLLYFNLIQNKLEEKLKRFKEVGIKGLVIPDLPLEEAEKLIPLFNEHNLDLILFISPTTREERIRKILDIAPSFLYCISVKGVTGERDRLPEEGVAFISRVKKETNKPLVWGFGLGSSYQINSLKGLVDGVIVGSAIGKRLLNNEDIQDYFDELYKATL
ncbi:tryptophan synthase subunit alpha [Dictyoglomus thermophilum]|uniref:Tryptophan synthase alpha chain n=1 Tax=Dictyoglomus thermophilum (strain ATCC 35947 / DSM 3960 / H-6-12) TaxID=309799 RepID=TRPA_DICT6|nr:tryptophan synthase subunit alpha [Dictyoglomus thermophilum]B5YD09.1 RecName: Full=Tryptophan synthase alpha chain [Dictyoglomus thermophilum H-6-12]ACI19187.1 tryptophan synthase, alpha subunit [Dictyoglomus thermophilum H-6-12]